MVRFLTGGAFQTMQPDEEIDYGVQVYRGGCAHGGDWRANPGIPFPGKASSATTAGGPGLGEEAVKLAPGQLYPEWALGEARCGGGGEKGQ